jgi:hypothetical protein
MRTPGVIVTFVFVSAVAGAVGYAIADRSRTAELVRMTAERDNGFIRERELQAQLEEALAARAALAQEAQQLQANLSERIQRLEAIADQLASEEKLRQEGKGE